MGAPSGNTPALDHLLRAARLASHAQAPAPLTAPSHASILTGLEPPSHGVRDNGTFPLPPDATTLPSILAAAGFRTVGVIGAFPLEARFGFDRGFEVFDDEVGAGSSEGSYLAERSAREVADRALELAGAVAVEERLFLWTHFFDPHHPRDVPRALRRLPVDDDYDREVRRMDVEIDRLHREFLLLRGREPVVAVLSDHGEALGQHGESSHGHLVYGPTMYAVFGVAAPAGTQERARLAPRIDSRVVRHSDLVPTLLDVLGLEYDIADFEGSSLLDEPDAARGAYGEAYFSLLHYGWSPLLSWRTEKWSYVEGTYAELFDLTSDPGETVNRIHEYPDVARELAKRLHQIAEEPSLEAVRSVDAETRAKLEALGYVGAGSEVRADRTKDPRALIDTANNLITGIDLLGKSNPHGALPFLERALAADPENVTAVFHIADAYRQVGRPRAAMEHYRRAIASAPSSPVPYGHLAILEYQNGNEQEAFAILDAGFTAAPDALPLLMTAADLHAQHGDLERARELYERAFEIEGRGVDAIVGLARIAERRGERGEAERLWTLAGSLDGADSRIPHAFRTRER